MREETIRKLLRCESEGGFRQAHGVDRECLRYLTRFLSGGNDADRQELRRILRENALCVYHNAGQLIDEELIERETQNNFRKVITAFTDITESKIDALYKTIFPARTPAVNASTAISSVSKS